MITTRDVQKPSPPSPLPPAPFTPGRGAPPPAPRLRDALDTIGSLRCSGRPRRIEAWPTRSGRRSKPTWGSAAARMRRDFSPGFTLRPLRSHASPLRPCPGISAIRDCARTAFTIFQDSSTAPGRCEMIDRKLEFDQCG